MFCRGPQRRSRKTVRESIERVQEELRKELEDPNSEFLRRITAAAIVNRESVTPNEETTNDPA